MPRATRHPILATEVGIVRWPFRIRAENQSQVRLHVELGFQGGRLADLIQLLARSQAVITDLEPDRSLYNLGMPERWAEVTFLAKSGTHKKEILLNLSESGFRVHEF